MNSQVERIKNLVLAGGQRIPADLVLKNGRVVNLFTGGVDAVDVAVHDGIVVGLGPGYEGREAVDVEGMWIAPGLIDGHIHIESSMLLPAVLPRPSLCTGPRPLWRIPTKLRTSWSCRNSLASGRQ